MNEKSSLLEKLNVDVEHEVKLALPNEIFAMLMNWKEKKEIKPTHLPFAYSYLYFTTYMYRYGKYNEFKASQSVIKEVLGYAGNYKPLDYIVKENGLLDTYKLTETVKDIPIGYNWIDYDCALNDTLGRVEIVKLSSMADPSGSVDWFRKITGFSPRLSVKFPRFAYVRDLEMDIEEIDCVDDYTGTFYDAKNTHIIDIRVFDFCMSHEDLGATGFYIYSYIKHKNDVFNGYDASIARLAKELGLSPKTIQTYRDALRKYSLVNLVHNMEKFQSQMKKEDFLAPTNYVNDIEKFSSEGVEYTKFLDSIERKKDKKETVTFKKKHTDGTHEIIEFDIEMLPF